MKSVDGMNPVDLAPDRPGSPDPDRRIFTRVPFEVDARLCNARMAIDTPLLDLSLKGAMLQRPTEFAGEIGERFMLDVPLGDGAVVIHLEVSLVHLEGATMGFRCELIDLASISHLRRLLELNLGDGELLERELGELVRGRPSSPCKVE